jgi:hypothetical protein
MENIHEKLILKNLLLDFNNKYKYLDDVNFNLITNITWKSINNNTPYLHYNTNNYLYEEIFTDYSEDKFEFVIEIQNCNKPIILTCINSNLLDKSELQSYKYIGSYNNIDDIVNIENIDKLCNLFSKNKLMYILEMFCFILGHLVNNNLDILE